MNWRPCEDVDREIRSWMKAEGWEVTVTNWDSERELYAWRHELRGGKSPTLRISRKVLEAYPAFAVLYHLDTLKVAAAIRTRPDVRYVVVQNGSGSAWRSQLLARPARFCRPGDRRLCVEDERDHLTRA